tara:strand:+ start:22128 stop:23093 length:966 start_codon:yes stop_codon:yes gene_type:complete
MDAIQPDVDLVEKESLTNHQSEIERIAEKVHEDHETEGQYTEEETPNYDEDRIAVPLVKKGESWYATAKVNGEAVDVEWDEILAQYQKNSSADKRLQEASERQRELEDYEAKLNAYRSDLEAKTRQPSPDAGTTQSPSSDATDALYEQYHDALFQGDENKASSLLKKIRATDKPAPQVDVNSIIARTKAEMREEEKQARDRGYEIRRKQAVEMFHSEYPDIAADIGMLAVADRRSAELYQSNPTRDPWDIMQECASYAQDWLKVKVDAMGGGSREVVRQERKQNMEEVTPKNVRAIIGEDEQELSYSDIISEMKQGRGQPA